MTAYEIIETQLKPIAKNGFDDALEILQLIALLETQNSNGINTGLSKAGAGRAAIVARNAFIARLTLLVVRCYAKPRDGDLHIRTAFDLIAKNKDVHEELCRRHSTEVLTTAEATWNSCRSDNRLEAARHFRDKYTAHYSQPSEDIALPKYNELFPFAIKTTEAMEALARAVDHNNHSLNDWNSEITESANEFWKPWTS